MNKKNGFTLVELLAVIIIIGILLLIAIPSVTKYLNRGSKEYYNSLENDILLAGRDYLNDYRTLLPKEIGNVTVISLDELLGNKYIDNVQDDKGKTCDAKVTVKKTGKNKYEYYSCLICDDYQSKSEYCDYSEDNNTTVETKNYKVEVEKDYYTVAQGSKFELPLGKAYYLGELVNSNVIGSPKIIDTNKIGTTTVTYSYQGAKKQIKVEIIDSVSPSIPQVVLKYDDVNGKLYRGGWYSNNIYAEFKSTDYTKPNLEGSGVSYYEISSNGSDWTKLSSNNYTSDVDGNTTYFVRSVDKSGNISQANSFNLKIDKTNPTCTISVSGTSGNDGWYSSDVVLSTTASQIPSGVAATTISQKSVLNNTSGLKITGTVTSNAGKVGSCSTTIKIDKTVPSKPTITATDNISSNNWHINNFNLTISGGSNISGNTYYYGTTTNSTTQATSITISSATSGTTYYIKNCSNAGLCSDNSNYIAKLDLVDPTTPIIKGGSSNWLTEPATISLQQVSTSSSGIKHYEYYKTSSSGLPTDNTEATGTTTNTLTVSDGGTTYIYYRAVSNSGRKSSWSLPQVINLKFSIKDKIIANSNDTFTITKASPQEVAENGIYSSTNTNTGAKTYFYRGKVTNNYVSFAGLIWRIVRVNEDGTIRIILQDGINNNQLVKYSETITGINSTYYSNSAVKTSLESWYNSTLSSYDSLIATEMYCEQSRVVWGTNNKTTNGETIYTSYTPTFKCANDKTGHGIINAKVGILSVDEVRYAGNQFYVNNTNNYLTNTSAGFWTMSPGGVDKSDSNFGCVWPLKTSGAMGTNQLINSYSIRPVINLNANITVTGTGTSSDPYIVH